VTAEAWREFGLCGQTDPELFFSGAASDVAKAKKLCGTCPSAVPCLDDALANGDDFGVRGGLTADERKELSGFTPVDALSAFLPQTDEAIATAFQRKEADDERRAAARRLKASVDADLDIHPLDRQVGR